MQDKIHQLKAQMLQALHAAPAEPQVREVEVRYLGRKGSFNEIMKGLVGLSDEEKRTVGKLANEIKLELEQSVLRRLEQLEGERMGKLAELEWIDVTVPGKKPVIGHRHPISKFIDEIETVFGKMGFAVAEGPEVEQEHYNFNQLNIPADHPARDTQDTFWIKNLDKYLLRTQTSPVQIRYMESHKPPIRIIAPGKTFRKDSDATHSPMFHQVEGLMIDENVSMANLKAVITHALQQIFEDPSIKTRFRISFFPFVEPGMEVDCTCPICHGNGRLPDSTPCRLCKQCGWLEIAGCGMVHPQVLKNVGYNPEKYTGFAFGMGLDRMVMIKYRIPHLRLFFENDLRFLRQF
ncbi:MAG: phenylalanine--tRNA ligase subunit alpha [Candidatus Peregrinibacteria bacterium]